MSSWVLESFCFQILHIEPYNYDFQLLFFKIKSKNALSRNIFYKTFKILYINPIWLKFPYSYIQYLRVKSYSRTVSDQTELSFILSLRYSSLQKSRICSRFERFLPISRLIRMIVKICNFHKNQ